jgi:transposase InsO family protein
VYCTQSLRDPVAFYATLGVRIDRVMTENRSGYVSTAFRVACLELGVRHIRTRPYTPQTNGKAERIVQASLREWAYAKAYESSERGRPAALNSSLQLASPHAALNHQPPLTRIPAMDNLLRLNS